MRNQYKLDTSGRGQSGGADRGDRDNRGGKEFD